MAVVGDSFTEAAQVDLDKTFLALAENELNRNKCLGARPVEGQVEGAERRAGIAGDHRRRGQAVSLVKVVAQEEQADERVDTGQDLDRARQLLLSWP